MQEIVEDEKLVDRVNYQDIAHLTSDFRMKSQRAGISIDDIGSIVKGSQVSIRDLSLNLQ